MVSIACFERRKFPLVTGLQVKIQTEDAPLAGTRAQSILKPLLLRRTKNSELEGKPLLELLPKHIEIVTEEFSSEEREVSSFCSVIDKH